MLLRLFWLFYFLIIHADSETCVSPRLSICAYLSTSHSFTICLKVSLFLSRFASLLRL